MTVTSKVRLYDLAKELKLDTKRLIEEVRREGVDVSVPSNSISKELAEKIRTKYFPKKEAAAKRVIKVVKRAALPTAEDVLAPEIEEEEPPAPEAEFEAVEPAETITEAPAPVAKPAVARLVKKLTPAIRVEPPVPEVPVEEAEQAPSTNDTEAPVVPAAAANSHAAPPTTEARVVPPPP